jgi:hypothetical protein
LVLVFVCFLLLLQASHAAETDRLRKYYEDHIAELNKHVETRAAKLHAERQDTVCSHYIKHIFFQGGGRGMKPYLYNYFCVCVCVLCVCVCIGFPSLPLSVMNISSLLLKLTFSLSLSLSLTNLSLSLFLSLSLPPSLNPQAKELQKTLDDAKVFYEAEVAKAISRAETALQQQKRGDEEELQRPVPSLLSSPLLSLLSLSLSLV